MNSVLKQRLVGALILIALGAIFWPMIFVNTGLTPVDKRSQIPTRIATRSVEIPVPQPNTEVEEALTPSQAARADELDESMGVLDTRSPEESAPAELAAGSTAAPAESSPEPVTAVADESGPAPTLDAEGIPVAWVLRVGSFATADKAESIRQKLIEMGYKANTRVVSSNGRKLVRVTVGPKFERQTLAKSKLKIDEQFKVNSQIVRYKP